MSQTESRTYATTLPHNWAKTGLGGQRDYLTEAGHVLDRLWGVVGLLDGYLKDDVTGHQELQDHFEALKHNAMMSCAHLAAQIKLCQKDNVAVFTEEEMKFKDVHTEHCCSTHGCKYGDDENCTVESGRAPQSFPCEYCIDS